MFTMPPPRKPKPEPEKKDTRTDGVFLRLGDTRHVALQKFIEAQKVPPKRASVILAAIDDYLRREGFLPPKA